MPTSARSKMCIRDRFAEAEGEPDLAAADEAPEPALPDLAPRRAQWEETARRDPDGLEAAIVKAIIGDRPLHPAQREICLLYTSRCV